MTRSEFKRHIEAGIAVADTLSDEQVAALREVAEEAKYVGTNFDSAPGCPATLAGLRPGEPGVARFAMAYDTALFMSGQPYHMFKVTG